MLQSDKIQSSEEGKIRLRQAYKEAGLSIEKLADNAQVSQDTVKRLLGTKECPNGVERWAVINIANALNIKPTDIVDPKDWNPQQQLPPEFEPLIKEKIKEFCGRKFVFDAVEKFLNTHPNGYFTVVGDAGMGKSAIAAKYVCDHHAICYFNILAERRNRPELFLKSIRQQLINRYGVQDAGDADLPTLLAKVTQKRPADEPVVIVVDALDEVEQEGTGNLLYLPITLPERVYFLLTRRPYHENERRLNVSPGIPMEELDLRKHSDESSQDVKEYIWQCLNQEQDWQKLLRKWIENRNLTCGQFVEEVSKKSENNFMYLKYVLPDIARGRYDSLSLDKLPTGLEGYYENHWQQMGMTSKPLPKNKIKIVYAMSALRGAASRPAIAKYSKQNELTVQEILEDWAQFLEKQDQYDPPRYRFYHESFRDFLHRKDIVQAAGISLPEISAEVAAAITGGIFGDE